MSTTDITLPNGKTLRLLTNTPMLEWRAKTFFTKEPETLKWLDTIRQGEVLYDVGANVGVYSLYAASRDIRVHAFEPEGLNFAALARNVVLNDMGRSIDIWPMAISDVVGYDYLYLSKFMTGGSCHSYGDEVGFDLKHRPVKYRQGVHATTIDTFADGGEAGMLRPGYIKIDVDGFEMKVLTGAIRTLPDVHSICIELNPSLEPHLEAIRFLSFMGFSYDPEQVARSTRTEGAFKGVAEYVFTR